MTKKIENRKVRRISVTLDENFVNEMIKIKTRTGVPISRQLEISYRIFKEICIEQEKQGVEGNGKSKYNYFSPREN